jgi:hypothetical protein
MANKLNLSNIIIFFTQTCVKLIRLQSCVLNMRFSNFKEIYRTLERFTAHFRKIFEKAPVDFKCENFHLLGNNKKFEQKKIYIGSKKVNQQHNSTKNTVSKKRYP